MILPQSSMPMPSCSPKELARPPGDSIPRLRTAADLYNWALTSSFESEDGSEVILRGERSPCLLVRLTWHSILPQLRTHDRELYQLTPTSELEVEGFAMRYRMAGLGSLRLRPRPGPSMITQNGEFARWRLDSRFP